MGASPVDISKSSSIDEIRLPVDELESEYWLKIVLGLGLRLGLGLGLRLRLRLGLRLRHRLRLRLAGKSTRVVVESLLISGAAVGG